MGIFWICVQNIWKTAVCDKKSILGYKSVLFAEIRGGGGVESIARPPPRLWVKRPGFFRVKMSLASCSHMVYGRRQKTMVDFYSREREREREKQVIFHIPHSNTEKYMWSLSYISSLYNCDCTQTEQVYQPINNLGWVRLIILNNLAFSPQHKYRPNIRCMFELL